MLAKNIFKYPCIALLTLAYPCGGSKLPLQTLAKRFETCRRRATRPIARFFPKPEHTRTYANIREQFFELLSILPAFPARPPEIAPWCFLHPPLGNFFIRD
jgi:hypothetical protein